MSTQTQTETTATVADETAELHPCACAAVVIEDETYFCVRLTKRTFAPGHDAKLKSRLIQAGFAGLAVHVGGQLSSVAEAAGQHGFGYQVASGIVRLQKQESAKAERKAARQVVTEANRAKRAAAKLQAAKVREAKADARREQLAEKAAERAEQLVAKAQARADRCNVVKIKVGRHEYLATIDPKTSVATYTSAKGETKTVADGKYKLV